MFKIIEDETIVSHQRTGPSVAIVSKRMVDTTTIDTVRVVTRMKTTSSMNEERNNNDHLETKTTKRRIRIKIKTRMRRRTISRITSRSQSIIQTTKSHQTKRRRRKRVERIETIRRTRSRPCRWWHRTDRVSRRMDR